MRVEQLRWQGRLDGLARWHKVPDGSEYLHMGARATPKPAEPAP